MRHLCLCGEWGFGIINRLMKFLNKLFSGLGIVILLAAAFFLGSKWGYSRIPEENKVVELKGKSNEIAEAVDFTPFWKVWNILNDKYVPRDISTSTKQVDESLFTQELVWGAVHGLTKSLEDPYTIFLPPRENGLFKSDIAGNFEGVGMEVGIRDGVITVISPLKDSPAEQAGVLAGDKVVKIGEQSTEGMTLDVAVDHIRGPKGTEVVITVYREGEPETIDISIIRDTINIRSSETAIIGEGENKVFVISMFNFSAPTPEIFRKALIEFSESGTDKLVIDLRNNPGGFMEAAVDMASWFLPEGKIVVSEYFGVGSREKVHRSRGYNVFTEQLKLAIVVNKGSASASEILAGALRDHGVAKLVGEQTFGKGSVQELISITDADSETGETSLKVTIARWLLPNGSSISGNGLIPEISVELPPPAEREEGRDYYLDAAVDYLRGL